VSILRLDDEKGVLADRNWPSGVLRVLERDSTRRSSAQLPDPHGIVLLQIHAGEHKNDGTSCHSAAGHLEPLVPAAAVFHYCAGVSHPLFTGRPAAWIPFLPHHAEKHFATLFYDGIINFGLESVQWARSPTSVLTGAEPFARHSQRAVLRTGSVIKFRVDARSQPEDSQTTTSDVTDKPSRELWGVVLLTYVRVSEQTTRRWLDLCRSHFSETEHAQLARFCALFPGTPVATCAVQELEGGIDIGKEFFASVHVGDVLEVRPLDCADALWRDMQATRYVPHLVVKPKTGRQVHPKKELVTVPLVRHRVLKLVEEQFTSRDSEFRVWFADQLDTTRSSDQSACLHSFYHDITRSAAPGFESARLQCLMAVRRLINVPQAQPKLSEEYQDKVDAQHHAAAPAPSATSSAAKAPRRSRPPMAEAVPAEPATSSRERAARETAQEKECKETTSMVFNHLSDIDVDESGAPFAALLRLSTNVLLTLSSGKPGARHKSLKNDQVEALKCLAAGDPASLAVLQTAAKNHIARRATVRMTKKQQVELSPQEREAVCVELAALPSSMGGAPPFRWRDSAGIRPKHNSPSFTARLTLQAQQQQRQQLPMGPPLGRLSLPYRDYGHPAAAPVAPAAADPQHQALLQELAQQRRQMAEREAAMERKSAELQRQQEEFIKMHTAHLNLTAKAAAAAAPHSGRAAARLPVNGRLPPASAGSNEPSKRKRQQRSPSPSAAATRSSNSTPSSNRDSRAARVASRGLTKQLVARGQRKLDLNAISAASDADEEDEELSELDEGPAVAARPVAKKARTAAAAAAVAAAPAAAVATGSRKRGRGAAVQPSVSTSESRLLDMMTGMQASIDAVRGDRDTAMIGLRGDLEARDAKMDARSSQIEKDVQRGHEELSKALELQDRRTSQIIDHINSYQQQQHRLLPSSAHANYPQLMAPAHPYAYSAPAPPPPPFYAAQQSRGGMIAHLMVDGQPPQMMQGWPLR
jgi:hypothetical protein